MSKEFRCAECGLYIEIDETHPLNICEKGRDITAVCVWTNIPFSDDEQYRKTECNDFIHLVSAWDRRLSR